MIGIYKNKKANAWINVLVILVLVTCLSSGFIFLTSSNKIKAVVSGVGVLNDVHLEENEFNFYVQQAGEKAVGETYSSFAVDEKPTEESFFSNFQKQFEIYGLKTYYLKKENFKIDSVNKILKVKIDNRKIQKNFKSEENNLEILYGHDLNFEFRLK